MLSLQASVASLTLFTLLLAAYSNASSELAQTKVIALQAMNKRFAEQSLKTTVLQALEPRGETCADKIKNAAEALKRVGEKLGSAGIRMEVGFMREGKCNCTSPNKLVEFNNGNAYASSAILSCIGEKLAIAKATELGFAVITFTKKENNYSYFLALDENHD